MERRSLGRTGIEVSVIGFGAWQLGNDRDWGGMDEARALRLVAAALEGGVDLFDTAPHYAGGRSEELLGKALSGRRDEVVLVSKFGHRPDGGKDVSVEGLRRSLEGSLRRLCTDRLDVLLVHNPDPGVYRGDHPIWEALEEERRRGRIGHYGASLDLASEAEACLRNTGSEVLEVLFNVLHQDVRRAFPAVRERGAGIVAKVPLDSGWLTGRFGAEARFTGVRGRWTREQIRERAELVGRVDDLTADGSPLHARALGFLLAYDEVSCVIPGVRTGEQLRANLAASSARLPGGVRAELEAFWDRLTGNGDRLLPW